MHLRQAWDWFWKKFLVDECPRGRLERNREERIRRIYQDVALLATMHNWERETRKDRHLETFEMGLLFTDLPGDIQEAYKEFGVQSIVNLTLMGGAAIVEAILIVDNSSRIAYTTRDGGESFEVGEVASTIHLSGHRRYGETITVHPIVNISAENTVKKG